MSPEHTTFTQAEHLERLKKEFCNNVKETSAGSATSYMIRMNPALLNSLREGGYIFYTRHAEATVGEDQTNFNFFDCSAQRNLSDVGRSQAVTYGESFRRLGIPIEYPVLASPFCRTRETAGLAFGGDNVLVNTFWFEVYKLSSDLSPVEQARILNTLHLFLEIQPQPGSNRVIVAHSFPAGVGFGPIPNMGTVIVKPHGPGNGHEVVAQLSLEFISGDRNRIN
ncbi:histidine phosphatase family protein [Alteribacillus sp. JSM 102045]|uniref:histidine phosphatase family protein n=1 Tax=Alteribacillus sp. JSM 102045 TaxID=1562101 RepID=UPI0035C1CEA1